MLIDIINNLQDYVSTEERATILRYINNAAKELYNAADLPNSLMERDFCVDLTNQQITLPWYAKEVRGVRRKTLGLNMTLTDTRPRYVGTPWTQPYGQWRLIAESPLEQHITAAGRLVVTLAAVESSAVDVTITGQTTTSMNYSETLTFAPGDLTKTTTKQFMQRDPVGIKSIVKSRITTNDLIVTQESDARQVATIPNVLQRASNLIISTRDEYQYQQYSASECFEVLFKWPYIELVNDTDEFLGTDVFDSLIEWRAKSNYSFLSIEDHPRMLIAEAKCKELSRRLSDLYESNTEKKIAVEGPQAGSLPLMNYPSPFSYGTH